MASGPSSELPSPCLDRLHTQLRAPADDILGEPVDAGLAVAIFGRRVKRASPTALPCDRNKPHQVRARCKEQVLPLVRKGRRSRVLLLRRRSDAGWPLGVQWRPPPPSPPNRRPHGDLRRLPGFPSWPPALTDPTASALLQDRSRRPARTQSLGPGLLKANSRLPPWSGNRARVPTRMALRPGCLAFRPFHPFG